MSELRRSVRVHFRGNQGLLLAGIIDQPVEPPKGFVIFSHCFTCSKDLKAIVRISRRLAENGWGVLRYDYAGIGESQGDFSLTNFSTNREDLRAASGFMQQEYQAPMALIGHSFGGATSLSLADELPSVRGVAVLAGPSDTVHLADLLEKMDPRIATEGIGEVEIGGRRWKIRKQMLEDLRRHDLPASIATLSKPVMILHSPEDETVGYEHAMRIFSWVMQRHHSAPASPGASLVSLSQADHLLVRNQADIEYVADTIHVWLNRLWAIAPQ